LQLFFSIFFMLQTLILDVVDAESRCCRHVLLGVANIFSMLQTLRFDVANTWCWVLCRGEGGKRL
jgi:hypothetical protein